MSQWGGWMNILFMAIWYRWNSPGLEAGLVLSFLKVCCFITQWEEGIEEQLLTLPCPRETGTSTEGEVHPQLTTNIFQPLCQRTFIVSPSTGNKPQHLALSPNVSHKLTEKSESCPFPSCSKPDRPDISVLEGKPVTLFETCNSFFLKPVPFFTRESQF